MQRLHSAVLGDENNELMEDNNLIAMNEIGAKNAFCTNVIGLITLILLRSIIIVGEFWTVLSVFHESVRAV